MSDNGGESVAMLVCQPFTAGGKCGKLPSDGDTLSITTYYFVKSACPGHVIWSDMLGVRVHLCIIMTYLYQCNERELMIEAFSTEVDSWKIMQTHGARAACWLYI